MANTGHMQGMTTQQRIEPEQAMEDTNRDNQIIQAYSQMLVCKILSDQIGQNFMLPVHYMDQDVFIPPYDKWPGAIH